MQMLLQALSKELTADTNQSAQKSPVPVSEDGDGIFAALVELPTETVDAVLAEGAIEASAVPSDIDADLVQAATLEPEHPVDFDVPKKGQATFRDAQLNVDSVPEEAAAIAEPESITRNDTSSVPPSTTAEQAASVLQPNDVKAVVPEKAEPVQLANHATADKRASPSAAQVEGKPTPSSPIVASAETPVIRQEKDTPVRQRGEVQQLEADRRPANAGTEISAQSKPQSTEKAATAQSQVLTQAGKAQVLPALDAVPQSVVEPVQVANDIASDVPPLGPQKPQATPALDPVVKQKPASRTARAATRDVATDAPLAQTQGTADGPDPNQNVQVTIVKGDPAAKDGSFSRDAATRHADPIAHLAPTEGGDAKKVTEFQATRTEPVAKPVISQIVNAAKSAIDGLVEVKLSPEELGRVRLTMVGNDLGMTVQVIAERQETLDLIRRNIDMLAADLADQGFQDLSFSFGEENQTDGNSSESNQTASEIGNLFQNDASEAVHFSAPIQLGQLDIRL